MVAHLSLSRLFLFTILAAASTASLAERSFEHSEVWTHEERMRLYAWVIVQDNNLPCDRVLLVQERRDGSVHGTCAVVQGNTRVQRYRIDTLPLKKDFSDRWKRIAESFRDY